MKDLIKKHRRNLLITFAWILVLIGMFVRTPIEGGIVFGALLIVISLLIAGYNKKIWDNLPLTSSWAGAISSIIFFIILFSGFLEWWSFNFRYGERQQGWHFSGAIILMAGIIPSSLLVTSFIGLWFETIKIKLFFWISIFIVPGLMFAAWIMIILMKALGLVGV